LAIRKSTQELSRTIFARAPPVGVIEIQLDTIGNLTIDGRRKARSQLLRLHLKDGYSAVLIWYRAVPSSGGGLRTIVANSFLDCLEGIALGDLDALSVKNRLNKKANTRRPKATVRIRFRKLGENGRERTIPGSRGRTMGQNPV